MIFDDTKSIYIIKNSTILWFQTPQFYKCLAFSVPDFSLLSRVCSSLEMPLSAAFRNALMVVAF